MECLRDGMTVAEDEAPTRTAGSRHLLRLTFGRHRDVVSSMQNQTRFGGCGKLAAVVLTFFRKFFRTLISAEVQYPNLLLDPVFGRHKYAKLSGITLHYVEKGPRNEALLLFLHGFPEFWFSWRYQIVEFSKDYWTVAVDLRGFGDSEKKSGLENYKVEVVADDIKELIGYLGRRRCTMVAHDWGGVVGHHFIRRHPELVDRYIFLNTIHLDKLNETICSNLEQLFKSWYLFMFLLPGVPEFLLQAFNFRIFDFLFRGFSTREEVNAYKYMFWTHDRRSGPINYYRANFKPKTTAGSAPSPGALNSFRIPGLYIHGTEDFTIDEELATRGSFEDIENVTRVRIPAGNHFVHIQAAGKVNQVIRDFLSDNFSSYRDYPK